jgi:hypothetical protein
LLGYSTLAGFTISRQALRARARASASRKKKISTPFGDSSGAMPLTGKSILTILVAAARIDDKIKNEIRARPALSAAGTKSRPGSGFMVSAVRIPRGPTKKV